MSAPNQPLQKILHQAGTLINCEQGHEIARLVTSIKEGAPIDVSAMLDGWVIDANRRVEGRCTCGAAWKHGCGTDTQLRIGAEWVPPTKPVAVKTEHVSMAEYEL